MNFTTANRTDDVFQSLFEWRSSKSFALAFSGIGTFVGLFVVYSVIWFEHNGYGNRRTIQVSTMGVRRGGQGGLLPPPPWPAKNSMFLDFFG
jgi:hypothetical protein